MKPTLFTIICGLLLVFPFSGSAQSFLDKVLKGVEKTNQILDETDKILGVGNNTPSSGRNVSRGKGFRVVPSDSDMNVQITRCVGTGEMVIIDFLITNEGSDRKIWLSYRNSTAFDDLGNQYMPNDLRGGNSSSSGSTFLPADVPVKCRMEIDRVKSDATIFKRISIATGLNKPIEISNLPITWKNTEALLPPVEEESVPSGEPAATQTDSGSLESGKTVNEDFDVFEEKFVSNPRFQMLRIKFDELGYNGEGEKWTQENWSIFKNKPSDMRHSSEYKYEQTMSDTQCIQRIWIPDSEFTLEYTYSKINGKWYLVKAFERF